MTFPELLRLAKKYNCQCHKTANSGHVFVRGTIVYKYWRCDSRGNRTNTGPGFVFVFSAKELQNLTAEEVEEMFVSHSLSILF